MDDSVNYDDILSQLSNIDGSGDAGSLEKLLKVLDEMEGMSEDEKTQLKTNLIMRALKTATSAKPPIGSQNYLILLIAVGILFTVFGKNPFVDVSVHFFVVYLLRCHFIDNVKLYTGDKKCVCCRYKRDDKRATQLAKILNFRYFNVHFGFEQ